MANLFVFGLLTAIAAASIRWKKLTVPAALTGGVLGGIIYAGAGFTGLGMLGAFFILGTAATAWRREDKRGLPGKDAHQSTRRTGQVLANGGVAALAAGLILLCPKALYPKAAPLLMIMLAASLASATADTLSSELGSVYGRRYYNILNGRPDQKGLDGVVSVEGLLIGVAGAALIAALLILRNAAPSDYLIVVAAGTIGNISDSILGATLERKGYIGNDVVNFLNTLIAAIAAGIIYHCCSPFVSITPM